MNTELSRAAASLADLSHTLESGERAPERLRRAIEQIRGLLRSDACAFAAAASSPAPAPPLVIVPELGADEAARVGRDARALLEVLADGDPCPSHVRRSGAYPHLAVPLIAVGRVVGLVLVERAGAEYLDRELQLLAIAASRLGGYLAVLEARENQRRTELALRDALAATKASDDRKVHFLNVLSHELRNPLAPLRNAVYVLDRSAPEAQSAQRARAIIGRQVELLARLLDDLLDAARISTGKVHLRRARLELAELVRRTVEDHRPLFLRNGVDLSLAVPGAPLWVDGDETRIAQVVGNLLGNAHKFTSAGAHVVVTVERGEPAAAVVRVRDDGVGIAPETLERLFEEFAQGDDALPRSHAGLGLGLALAKGLVELHGGTITARSEGAGKGAEFEVSLPLAAAGAAAASGGAVARRAPAAPRRILVIDDNQDAAESLRDLLRLSGHAVEAAVDGPSGVALARTSRPDVVLCDIGLPGMNGYDVARALRALPELGGTILVALTGFGSEDDRRRAQDAGFHHHLVKPVALPTLEQLLGDLAH